MIFSIITKVFSAARGRRNERFALCLHGGALLGRQYFCAHNSPLLFFTIFAISVHLTALSLRAFFASAPHTPP